MDRKLRLVYLPNGGLIERASRQLYLQVLSVLLSAFICGAFDVP
jgi:hypothetical protein